MLPSIDSAENKICSNGEIGLQCKNSSLNTSLKSDELFSNRTPFIRGRQGEFRDVKSIIDDFRESNPDILSRVGKRLKTYNPNSLYRINDKSRFVRYNSIPQVHLLSAPRI